MRHFGFDTSRLFTCVVRLCTQKVRSSEIKIANPKQVTYCFPVPALKWVICLLIICNYLGLAWQSCFCHELHEFTQIANHELVKISVIRG